jgi:drug/metabolite transporter (DMT)-like permease
MLIQIPILSVLFLGERVNLKEIIGLVLAGLGTVIVQLARRDEAKGSGIGDQGLGVERPLIPDP